jgi:aminopeptidase N
LLSGAESLEGLTLDTDMRWSLVTGLAGANALEDGEIEAELKRDPTATGRERAARARAAVPTPEAKEAAWKAAVEDAGLSNSMVDAYGLGFGRLGDVSALEPYVARYHDALASLEDKGSMALVESIVVGFYPRGLASVELRDATQAWLDSHPDAHDALRRIVAENRDPITRALAAQERDARA